MIKRKANTENLFADYFEMEESSGEEESSEESSSSDEDDFALMESGGDTQSYMSVQALNSMIEHSEMLLEIIDENTPLPDWVEYKLAQASGMMTTVLEYMKHGGHSKAASTGNFQKDMFGELRTYFQEKGSLEKGNKITFLNDTEDLFEFTVEPTGFVEVLVNHHLFVSDVFSSSQKAMKEIKKQINDHVYGF